MTKTLVGIVIGSDTDLPIMVETAKVLQSMKIGHEIRIISAHRTPLEAAEYAAGAPKRGIEVLIAGAGGAAHLAGTLAAHTTLPVLCVPMPTTSLDGIDSLYSIVQMPSGVPVATLAIGKPGAKNAAILAAQILALKYDNIREQLIEDRRKMQDQVREKDRKLQELGYKKYLEERRGESK